MRTIAFVLAAFAVYSVAPAAGSWPAANGDASNRRAATATTLDARTIARTPRSLDLPLSAQRNRVRVAVLGIVAAPSPAAGSHSAATAVTVATTEFHFKLPKTSVAHGTVTFTVKNAGKAGTTSRSAGRRQRC